MPTLDDLAGTTMTARTGDKFNPPGLTNFLGCLQAAPDVMGIQHLTFPPFSQGDTLIGLLTVNDTLVHASGIPVAFRWRPDRIERSLSMDGLDVSSVAVMGVGRQSAHVSLTVENRTEAARDVRLRVRTGAGVIRSRDGWKTPYSPKEGPAISVTPWEGTPPPETLVRNAMEPLGDGHGIVYSSTSTQAFSLQATVPRPDSIERSWFDYTRRVEPGCEFVLHFSVFVGGSRDEIAAGYELWKRDPGGVVDEARRDWEAEIAAVFTPGNNRYSGHLPTPVCRDADLLRIYYATVLGVVYMKRVHPDSQYGRTYVTIMPRYWVTSSFINDWAFSAYLLVMLDPDCVQKQVELWLTRDIYAHFGTEYVSGTSSGNWYSCNDYSMVRLITTWLRVTGDFGWLSKRVGDLTVLEHLRVMLMHYRVLDAGSGLADYGDRNSLLEAVGSYTHEVASVNAANVWMMREVAALMEHLRDTESAATLRDEAAAFVPRVQKLYVSGAGYWCCRQPDGEMIPVRHIWDVIHTLNFLAGDMPERQVEEIIRFFRTELMHDNWAAALSPHDEDASFSLRLDHQWNGSWPGWIAFMTRALYRTGRHDLLRGWLPGLARTANQGPWSQAHFVETYAESCDGGARKGPTEWPYINDWAVICAGGFVELLVLDLFGVEFGFDELTVRPSGLLADGDHLLNLPFHGRNFDVEAHGVVASASSR